MTADKLFNSLISHCSPTVFWRGFCKENIDVKAWVLFDEVHHWVEFLFLKQSGACACFFSLVYVFLRAYVCRLDSNVYLSTSQFVIMFYILSQFYISFCTPQAQEYTSSDVWKKYFHVKLRLPLSLSWPCLYRQYVCHLKQIILKCHFFSAQPQHCNTPFPLLVYLNYLYALQFYFICWGDF